MLLNTVVVSQAMYGNNILSLPENGIDATKYVTVIMSIATEITGHRNANRYAVFGIDLKIMKKLMEFF